LTIVLEVEKSGECVGTEYTIHLSRVEAEGIEVRLKAGNVIPSHHGYSVVEQTIAESVSSIDDGSPRFRTNDSVHGKSPAGLERGDGIICSVTENAGIVRKDREVEGGQSVLYVAHRLATISSVVEPHEPENN
jgi:hypothetical protein